METTGISLGTLNFELQMLCATPLYNGNELLKKVFLQKYFPQIQHTFPSSCDFNSLFVNGNVFSFSKPIIFLHVILRVLKTFSCNLFHIPSILVIYMTKAPDCWHWISRRNIHWICSPISVVEDFSGLFAHPSIFLIKHSRSA